jgi:hypothetical protein
MKSLRGFFIAGTLVMLPIATWGQAPDEVKVTGFVTTAKQDGPLQIIGFRLPEKIGHSPKVVVRNISSQQIVSFTIRITTGNLARGSLFAELGTQFGEGSIGPPAQNSVLYPLWRKERSVLPGSESEVEGYNPSSSHSVVSAAAVRSNCVHSLAMVNRVEFADGTDWEWLPNDEELDRVWKGSILPGSSKSCDNSPKVTKLMEKLRGPAYIVRDSLTHADTAVVQHYSISCPLRPMHGKLFAVCPM